MPSGTVSFILNSDTMDTWNPCLLICNSLEHKIAVLLKIHEDVESSSAPHYYVLVSKSNSSKLSFSLEHACVTLKIEKEQIWEGKKYHFQTVSIETLQFNIWTWLVTGCLIPGLCSDSANFKVWFLLMVYKELPFQSALANLCSRFQFYWIIQGLLSCICVLTS